MSTATPAVAAAPLYIIRLARSTAGWLCEAVCGIRALWRVLSMPYGLRLEPSARVAVPATAST